MKFAQNTYLDISGTLNAAGAAGNSVYFTDYRDDTTPDGDTNGDGDGSSPGAGWWWGINVMDGGSATLNYTTVRYAVGSYYGGWPHYTYRNFGSVYKTGAGSLILNNSTVSAAAGSGVWIVDSSGTHSIGANTVQNGGSHGILLQNTGSGVTVSGNTVSGNGSTGIEIQNSSPTISGNTVSGGAYGIHVTGVALPALVTNNTLNGNASGPVGFAADSSGTVIAADNTFSGPIGIEGGTITRDTSWVNSRVYHVLGGVGVGAGATLTVPAGRVVKLNQNVNLDIYGTLAANGAAGNGVYFTDYRDDTTPDGDTNGDGDGDGSSPGAGWWWGINVMDGGSAILNYTTVRYAYGGYIGGWPYYIYRNFGSVYKTGAGSLILNNSTVGDAAGYGVWIVDSSGTHGISDSTVQNSGSHGILLQNTGSGVTVSGSTVSGNGSTGIEIQNSSPTISGNTVSGGGYGIHVTGVALPALVTNNTLNGNASGPVGFAADSSGTVIAADNTFSGPIGIEGGTITRDTSWVNSRVYHVLGGVGVGAGATLTVPAGRVVKLNQNVNLDIYGTLAANGAAGNGVYFTDYRDDTTPDGDTNGDGSATSPAAGWWWGINVMDGGAASLNYTTVRYAYGGYIGGWPHYTYRNFGSVYKTGAGSLILNNSTVGDAAGYGVWIVDSSGTHGIGDSTVQNNGSHGILLQNTGAGVTVSGSTVSGNGDTGVYASGNGTTPVLEKNRIFSNSTGIAAVSDANPLIGGSVAVGNEIFANTAYGVRNDTATVTVNARNNWWGSASGPTHEDNPGGTGDRVSDQVDYGQYLGVPASTAVPNLVASPGSWDAGSVLAGEVPTKGFTVTNNGTVDLVLTAVDLAGADAVEFEIRDDLCGGATLAPFETCAFTVAYLRITAGAKSASVELSSNDPDGVTTVNLSGTGLLCTPPPAGLVSWWRAEGDAVDELGANGGTMFDATYAPGKAGQAFSFDGTSDSYVEIADHPSLNPADAFTIGGWFYIDPGAPGNVGGEASLVAKTTGGVGDGGWFLWFQDSGGYTKALRFDILTAGVSAWPYAEVNNIIVSAGWYHIAGVFDLAAAAQAKLYVNGALAASSTYSISAIVNNTLPVRIGASHWGAGDRFEGEADDVEFFNRALGGDEIAAMYNAGDGATCPGPYIVVNPASHDFGDLLVDGTSAPAEFTISNIGLMPLTVSAAAPAGGDAGMFSAIPGGSSPCESATPTLEPGSNCTLTAAFAPTAADVRTTSLRVASNDPQQPSVERRLDGRGLWELQVTIDPAGSGAVAGGGIDCPDTCSATAVGGSLELSATAQPGYTFTGWSGAAAGSTAPVSLVMDGHKSVTATFTYIPVTFEVCASGCAYDTIQGAIDAAGPWDVVQVAAGTYRENLRIEKSLTLRRGLGLEIPALDMVADQGASTASWLVINGDVDANGVGDGNVILIAPPAGEEIAVRLENLVLTGGWAENGGGLLVTAAAGATADVAVVNTVVALNDATHGAGLAMIADGAGSAVNLRLLNSTIGWNDAGAGGGMYAEGVNSGAVTIEATNQIVWGNRSTAGEDIHIVQGGGTVRANAAFSDIGGVSFGAADYPESWNAAASVFAADPLYANPSLLDLRLTTGSPAIDAGDVVAGLTEDFEGDARTPGAVDIGADEYTAPGAFAALKLTSLNGGERIAAGEPYLITWGAPAGTSSFRVWYSLNGGVSWKSLTPTPLVDPRLIWQVPLLSKNSTRCLIKITGMLNGRAVLDKSDKTFAVEVLRLLSPNGKEHLISGDVVPIVWKTYGTKLPVASSLVQYSVNGGSTWKTIAKLEGSPGSFPWTVPAAVVALGKCRVQVLLRAANGAIMGKDGSDAIFNAGRVLVLAPNGGEKIAGGAPTAITWVTDSTLLTVANTTVSTSVNGGKSWSKSVLEGNPGTFSWTPNRPAAPQTKCKVKVELRDTAGKLLGSDFSDALFTVRP